MSRVLLDTNVLSELVRPKPTPRIQAFVRAQADPLISVLTLHEIVYGAERAPDPVRRARLTAWVAAIRDQFAGRIIDIDPSIVELAGRWRAAAAAEGEPADPIDALIAACAGTHGAIIATRNTRDFAGFGVSLIDPWTC
ncbi:MAG: type II toxin-antitoxin system VapC family toxin [Hyphomicrobiales bacterium]|nr:type II toxin-antitoxin system VapC family toxin [Hyphomicrobiales bacterium]